MINKVIVFLFLIICTSVYSQRETKEQQKENLIISDTLKDNIEKLNSFRLRFHTFRQKFFNDKVDFTLPVMPYSTWMLRSGFYSNDAFAPLLQKDDMVRSYNMLYGVDNDLKYLHMVLGMAETATVGVLAYKHIKKYGFLSK